ncbi:MAG: iron-sulfur cluster assembly scaffold protein [Candidatus Delongbacteria bacterium]|nr:iron-sulfur cluster assembly scaffold protein [Candidatus Delongbacteria bacterium]
MYSKEYIRHFSDPQNIGAVDDPDITCTVVNTEGGCFDTVDVTVKSDNGVITDMKYRLKACSGTITAFSLLSGLVRGKTADELDSITFEQMDAILGKIPEKKHHSLRLAVEAVQKIKEKLK